MSKQQINNSVVSDTAAEDADDSDSGNDNLAESSGSELDAEDYENKREKCLKQLVALENQFQALREQLYKERVAHLEKRHQELVTGVAADLRARLHAAEEQCTSQIEITDRLFEYQKEALRIRKEAADMNAARDRDNAAQLKYDEMHQKIQSKIDALKAEKHVADVNIAFWMAQNSGPPPSTNSRSSSSNSKRRRPGRPVTVSGAHIVYLLPEDDIESDWLAIKRASIAAQLCANSETAHNN